MNLERLLRALLDRGKDRLEQERRRAWERCTDEGRFPFVLFGAGGLGRSTYAGLKAEGRQVLAFADNDPAKWGSHIDGVPVLAPTEAVRRHGSGCCFVVCIWRAEGGHRFQDTRTLLHQLGAGQVVHFGDLARAFPNSLLPHYSLDRAGPVVDAAGSILESAELFEDPPSKEVFLRHILWRLTLDFDLLPTVDPREIYFPAGILAPQSGDILVDAGAYDGDTAFRFLELWGDRARAVHAFEPDPSNANRFRQRFESRTSGATVQLHEYALSCQEGELQFNAEGSLSSRESASGNHRVRCRPLDAIDLTGPVGLLKMDVEGAEPDILAGARRVIESDRPRLAVCLYHRQSHLWEIPRQIHQLAPGYNLRLLNHGSEAWDLVLYATAS